MTLDVIVAALLIAYALRLWADDRADQRARDAAAAAATRNHARLMAGVTPKRGAG